MSERAASSPAELAVARTGFYRDRYRSLLSAFVLLLVLCLVLVGAVTALAMRQPATHYFATDETGRIVALQPLDQPHVNASIVLDFAERTTKAAYSYSFATYRDDIGRLRDRFSQRAFQALIGAITDSRNLEAVKSKKLVVTAATDGAPVITAEGVIEGRYAWRIEVPLTVTYQSSSERVNQSIVAKLLVRRAPRVDRPEALEVDQFVVLPRT